MSMEYLQDMDRGFCNDLGDLAKLRWLGDDRMEEFKIQWDSTVYGLREPQTEDNLRAMFWELMKHSKALAVDIRDYRRAPHGHPDHTYAFLYNAMVTHLERERKDKVNDELAKARGLKGSSSSAFAATEANPPERSRERER